MDRNRELVLESWSLAKKRKSTWDKETYFRESGFMGTYKCANYQTSVLFLWN